MVNSFLTPKQKKLLEFIDDYSQKKGYAPSQKEIAKHFRFRSLGTVQNYLVRLERQGAIRKEWQAKRSLRVSSDSIPQSPSKLSPSQGAVPLPIVGEVAAGRPIEALERDRELTVPSSMLRSSRDNPHFVLRVVGNSMIEDGILDGDYVVIRKQDTANWGQTVVALIENEATIKRYYPKKTHVELRPANAAFQSIIVEPGTPFRIEGVLSGVIRQF